MFQALQAVVSRRCFSSAVAPTPMKPPAISEIISDIFCLVELSEFIR